MLQCADMWHVLRAVRIAFSSLGSLGSLGWLGMDILPVSVTAQLNFHVVYTCD